MSLLVLPCCNNTIKITLKHFRMFLLISALCSMNMKCLLAFCFVIQRTIYLSDEAHHHACIKELIDNSDSHSLSIQFSQKQKTVKLLLKKGKMKGFSVFLTQFFA